MYFPSYNRFVIGIFKDKVRFRPELGGTAIINRKEGKRIMGTWKLANREALNELNSVDSFLSLMESHCLDFEKSKDELMKVLDLSYSSGLITISKFEKLSKIIKSIPSQKDIAKKRASLISGHNRFLQVICRKDEIFPLAKKQENNRNANQKRVQQGQERKFKYGEIYHSKRLELMHQLKDREATRKAIELTQERMEEDGLKVCGDKTLKNYESFYLDQIQHNP